MYECDRDLDSIYIHNIDQVLSTMGKLYDAMITVNDVDRKHCDTVEMHQFSPNMIRYLFINWLYLLHYLTDIMSQMPCPCDTVTLISSKATYFQPNKPYDEVLGAAQLIKRVKACKSL